MDLPSGFNVESWESEGTFDAPENHNVSLALTEDETPKCKTEMPQAAAAAPSEQSPTLQDQHHYELEASINIPVAGELVADGETLVESNLGLPVTQDSIDIYEQQFLEHHGIKPSQQVAINDIPLPNETDLLTQSLKQIDKNEGLNSPTNAAAQIESPETVYTECLTDLPFSQETSSIAIDGGDPASVTSVPVHENVVTTFNNASSSETCVSVQENIVTTFNVVEQEITEEYILPDHEMATEEDLHENVVNEADLVEVIQPSKIEMTEVEKREPEDLLADLNSSEENTETQSLEESGIEYNNNAETILAGITTETGCNLPSAVNSKSVIDLVLPVVDAASVTMTDPVSLRPGKPSVATHKTAQASSELEEDADTFYTLPAHVIGQPSDNPLEEQKLRPGLKNSMNYMRSHILSKTELVQELQERNQKKSSECKYPEKGDIFFAKTLTKRLASHINVKADAALSGAQDSVAAATTKLAPLPPTLSAFKESKAKKSTEQSPKKADQEDGKQDDTDLLAILEGEVDDWTIDRPPPQLIEAASSPINIQQHPPKLDPSVERELALQQLSNMPVRVKRVPSLVKPSVKKPARKSTVSVQKASAGGSGDQSERPLRKRKIEVPAVAAKKPVQQSNGAANSVVVASQDASKNIASVDTEAKQPRIFKTKRMPGGMTNGTTSAPGTSKGPVTTEAEEPKPKAKASEAADVPALVTRELISPPRTYSSRIKKSTFSDDFVFPSTSKSRVVPVVSSTPKPAKKVTKPAAKVETSTQVEATTPIASTTKKPAAKAVPKTAPKVSPKKAKPAEAAPTPNDESTKSPVTKTPKKVPKKLSEIDRLLMDEGAINMLYAVEQNEEKRRSGGGDEPPVRKRLVKSTRHSAKELLMKTRLVKSAVQRLRNTPDSSAVSLRTKRTSGPPPQPRKTSIDSNVSLQSPPPLTPAEPSSPTQVFSYPPRLRPPAEASRIIRRHSSSSNFSSRSASPTNSRRLSVDVTAPEPEDSPVTRETRKRGSNLYITKLQSASGSKKKKIAVRTASVEDAIFQPNVKTDDLLSPSNKTKLQNQMAKNFQKSVKGKAGAVKKTASTESVASAGKGKAPDLTACLAEAVTAFIAEDGNLDSSNVPPGLSTESCLVSPISPSSSFSYSSLIKTLEADCQRRADDSAKERTSPRQSVGLGTYKELSIRRHDNMVQVILAPVSTKMMDSLNPQVLKELQDVLTHLQKDDSCRAVLLTSTGSAFCLGLDFHSLIIEKAEKRKAVAQQFALTLKHFMTSLSQFSKPIIAGVHGAAVGLGVTMLPFFDMVFASDKATFYTPYAKLGQVPEGAAVVALPQLLGNAVTSELLYACRKLTASEALQYGLVTRILWPDRFHEELLPLINSLAAQSAQSMEATKALLRYNLRARVDAALESEAQLLVQHWSSAECQANFKRFLDDEDIGLQRQRSADV